MENNSEQPEKTTEPQTAPAEASSEQKPEIDIYEQKKTLTEEEKAICPKKIEEFLQAIYLRGLIQKTQETGVRHVPVSLSPTPIPKNLFEKYIFIK